MKSGGAAATPSKPAAAHQSPRRLLAAALLALSASAADAAATITGGQYAAPVEHYGHFALGRPHEYARLTVSTSNGQRHSLELPEDAVFEDLAPRLVTLAAGEPPELLAIVSQRDSGSRLALIGLRDDRLEISAQSPPIGTPMRWLNPVGVADLDGDGQAEIAAVTTPHRSGTLRIYRRKGKQLLEVAALAGVSNHVYGSSELAMSLALTIAGEMQLLVPDSTHLRLRIIALHDGQLLETAHCPLAAALTGAIRQVSATEVSVELLSGPARIALQDCPASQE
ncbi:MAG: VCBS repeat-containing protein [Candidatus Accumulibacter meliphilus]|uniref:VCBS repeat-containing protein n=1 Tax=Candidatus Accumulibacter meliphilus TaxID=2211374 RepID=UPI002FC311A2